MNLDFSTWKKYRLGDLFEIKKGKRLTAEDQTEGFTPYIGAIDSNNGIANHIGQDAIHLGNTISLSYNGSVGEAFYQPVPFWATDDVNVLYFRDENGALFNEKIALFICTVLRKEKYRYCYGRKWTLEQMNDTIIKLPSINGKPDWKWINDYVDGLHSKPISTTKRKSDKISLDTASWKEFYLYRIFIAGMGNGIDAVMTTNDEPKYNYVSRDSNGNGVVGFVDEIDGEIPFPAGAMSLALGGSYLGSCFIQKKPFYTAQNVAVCKKKCHFLIIQNCLLQHSSEMSVKSNTKHSVVSSMRILEKISQLSFLFFTMKMALSLTKQKNFPKMVIFLIGNGWTTI